MAKLRHRQLCFKFPLKLLDSNLLICSLAFIVIIPQTGLGMSVPILPAIADEFGVAVSSTQGTLVAYMVGYAFSVLCSGYLSDRYGPRRVQLLGLSLGTLATAISALSPDIHVFYACRFFQALGVCVSTVTSRLIISTTLSPEARMPALTTLTSALAITPCLAPLAGGLLLSSLGWRGVLATTAVISSLSLILFFWITRSLPQQKNSEIKAGQLLGIYVHALRRRSFLFYAASISLVWMSYFSFVSCSAGPLQLELGLTPIQYGLILSIAAIGYVCGSQSARKLARRLTPSQIIRSAATIGFISGSLLILYTLTAPPSILVLLPLLLPLLFATGMTIPASQAGILQSTSAHTGIVSGLFFFIQMMAGAFYAGIGNSWASMTTPALFAFSGLPFLGLPVIIWILNMESHRDPPTPSPQH